MKHYIGMYKGDGRWRLITRELSLSLEDSKLSLKKKKFIKIT